MAEFFVMRKYRRRGVGKQMAFNVFDRLPGKWEVRQVAENNAGIAFWRRIILEYTGGNVQETLLAGEDWRGPAQSFDNRAGRPAGCMVASMKLDWQSVVVAALGQFAPWLAVVLVVMWAGYPGVVCVTPMAWLIALRVGLVCVDRSRSVERGWLLLEAALAGALIGLLQGLLFWVVVPRMGPILPSEQARAVWLEC